MKRVLHLLTRCDDPLARECVAAQEGLPEVATVVFDLTRESPDYDAVLEAVFEADTVCVW